jgi:hypothetical protein
MCLSFDLLHDKDLDDISRLDIAVLFNGNAAFKALRDLFDIVLKSAQGGDRPSWTTMPSRTSRRRARRSTLPSVT